VTTPKGNLRPKPNDQDPGFWQNVEYNRYGNKKLEAHQFITPASYKISQPIRFLSIDNSDDTDSFDEVDQEQIVFSSDSLY